MAINKVVFGDVTLIDITDTTAVAADVADGKRFYLASGQLAIGTNTGGGGAAISVVDTLDPGGGTIRTITAVDLSNDTVDAGHMFNGYTAHNHAGQAITGSYVAPTLISKSIGSNGTYDPSDDNADGYDEVTVDVPTGLIIPSGFAYFNGYLLPQIPTGDGYDYAFIRKNDQTGNFDLVLGTSQWRTRSNASLDSWSLEFANQATDGSRQYSIPQSGDTTTATSWGEYVTSVNYYGTNNGRKVIFTSHDIMINTTGNVLLRHGIAIYPPQ